MTQKRHLLATRLLLSLLALLTAQTAGAVESTTFPLTNGQTWTNTTTNTKYTVSGDGDNWTLTVSVADASVNDGKGTIADKAFYNVNLGNVKTIVIGAGITSIGEYAFSTWPKDYTTVTFEANSQLTTVKKGAFYTTSTLTSINLDDCLMLESIGNSAFNSCSGLTHLDFSRCSHLTSIEQQAFYYCTSLNITIPEDVTLGSNVFDNCASVTKVGVTLDGLTFNTTDKCYDIGTLTELQAFMTYANNVSGTTYCKDMTFRLTDDIDMTGQTYTPVGNFKGTFNGNSHAITGLSGSNGLFALVAPDGTVTGLTLSGVNISGGTKVGAVAGSCSGVIENCYVTGKVSGASQVGGIVGFVLQPGLGYTNNPHVSGCTFSGTVTGTGDVVGGIVGKTIRQIQNCTVSGSSVSGQGLVGGIAGLIDDADAGTVNYDISGCTVAGVSVNVSAGMEGYSGKVCGYVNSDITTDPAVIATYIHDNNVYYSVTCGEGITATYASGDKMDVGGTDCYKTGATLTIGHIGRDGYNWNGWAANSGGVIGGATLTIQDSDVVLNGLWLVIDYTITYDLAGGSVATENPTTYTVESADVTLVNPTRDGYTFAGWTGTDLTDATNAVTIAAGSTGNREYTATWTPIEYTITYDLDGGTVATPNPTSYTIEDAVTLNNPTKNGYTFAGWTGTDLTDATNAVTIAAGSTGNRTFTATWTPAANITLAARQAPDGNYWTTFYCGEAGYTIDAEENACAYTATYADGKLTLHNQGKTSAKGEAVIIVADNNEVSMTKGDDGTPSAKNDLHGVDVDTPTADIQTSLGSGTFYVLGMTNVGTENRFGFHPYDGAEMAARKAFVLLNGEAALARSLTMVFDTVTGISNMNVTDSDDVWYSLDGRKLQSKPTASGVYVNNGRKIVIK